MANHILLQKNKLTSSAASVTFSNIPQSGYTDLKIVVSGRTAVSDPTGGIQLTVNGSTSGYTNRHVYGDGSSAGSYANNTSTSGYVGIITGATATASTFGSVSIYCPNYTGSANKSFSVDVVGENNATTAYAMLNSILWSNTAAITSITLTAANSSTFVQYSTFSLYGVAATGTTPATAPKADGGNIISTDGTYWYHAFLSSGFFTPITSLTCDYLVVAGGGGGGGNSGGGGGAGGYRTGSSFSVTATNYEITIGAGGVGAAAEGSSGTSGSNSIFSTITSTGGGLGAGYVTAGGAGGSGGGGNEVSSTAGGAGNTPSTSPSQGNNGAAGAANRGGGGGGAGAAGSGKDAGNGSYTAISGGAATGLGQLSGGNYYFAGGGGAGNYGVSGVGGLGGGGTGAAQTGTAQTAGTVNTGGGGGGGGDSARTGRDGGSGVVIIRYAV